MMRNGCFGQTAAGDGKKGHGRMIIMGTMDGNMTEEGINGTAQEKEGGFRSGCNTIKLVWMVFCSDILRIFSLFVLVFLL